MSFLWFSGFCFSIGNWGQTKQSITRIIWDDLELFLINTGYLELCEIPSASPLLADYSLPVVSKSATWPLASHRFPLCFTCWWPFSPFTESAPLMLQASVQFPPKCGKKCPKASDQLFYIVLVAEESTMVKQKFTVILVREWSGFFHGS